MRHPAAVYLDAMPNGDLRRR